MPIMIQITLDGRQNCLPDGIQNEEAYIKQPKGFIDPYLLEHVFKLKKT